MNINSTDEPTIIDHYFLPYLENAEYKESFVTEQALLTKRAKHVDT